MDIYDIYGDGIPDIPSFDDAHAYSTQIGDRWTLFDRANDQVVAINTDGLTFAMLTADDLRAMLSELEEHSA